MLVVLCRVYILIFLLGLLLIQSVTQAAEFLEAKTLGVSLQNKKFFTKQEMLYMLQWLESPPVRFDRRALWTEPQLCFF